MAGAYENSIHQWKVIVVFVIDCACVLTLDESAGKLYTISANEAGSRAHKAAGASAHLSWVSKTFVEGSNPSAPAKSADSKESAFFHISTQTGRIL